MVLEVVALKRLGWWCIFLAGLCPLFYLIWLALMDQLGPDPAEVIVAFAGLWALRFLVLTLAVTPLRVSFGQRWMQRYRRMWGLYVWFYASLHLLAFTALILDWQWLRLGEELIERPYITLGGAAYLLVSLLGVTSSKAMMHRLGRRWGSIHRWVYGVVLLAMVHFFWQVRSDLLHPLVYAAIFTLLLGYRLWRRYRSRCFGVG